MLRTAIILIPAILLFLNGIPGESGWDTSLWGCTPEGSSADSPQDATDKTLPLMRGLVELYSADRSNLGRFYDAPMSKLALDQQIQFLRSWQRTLADIDFDALDQDGKIDHLLLQNELRYHLRSQTHQQKKHEEIAEFVPFAQVIIDLQEARRRVARIEPKNIAEIVSGIPEAVKAARVAIEGKMKADEEGSPFNPSVALRAARIVERLNRTLSGWFRFHDGYDPLFSWWVAKPYEKARGSLKDYAGFIRKKVAGITDEEDPPIIGDPVGREELLSMLESEMIAYSPEQLLEIARREFEWCRKEMLRASNDLGHGDDWRAALDHVKNLHVDPGEQPTLIRDLAVEAVAFLEERDLVTIPQLCKDTWRMEMLSAERQKISPYFLGGEVIMVAFPTHEMEHADKKMSMRGNNKHFARATVQHELIPGHHLQGFMNRRHRTHRRAFSTPFWGEGWALYWEMLLWDKNFARSAEDRIGMLFWRTHRCARIIFSLSYHLEKMTAEEAIDFLVENVGHERNNATAEVRRSVSGSYGPLYQAAYMLGGLQLMALHREMVDSKKMTDRDFHDAILRNNSIPIEMVRAAISGHELDRNHRPKWHFYGEVEVPKDKDEGGS